MKKEGLSKYLRRYSKIQSKILLCYHPTEDSWWNDRCYYLQEGYSPHKAYNHRGVLASEIVIEFDTDDKKQNKKYAMEVCERLRKDKIDYSAWYSGNKSTHVHCFIETGQVSNLQLLKKCFMREYTEGLPVPDLRLAAENHLIRAEFGVHEKTGQTKKLIAFTASYPKQGKVKQEVWDRYQREYQRLVNRKMTMNTSDILDHPGLKYVLTTHQFKEANDGRERAIFMLIHLLKPKYKDKKEDLIAFLQEWNRYVSNKPGLSDDQIRRKVGYHWNKDYTITENYLNEFLESIGREDLVNNITEA